MHPIVISAFASHRSETAGITIRPDQYAAFISSPARILGPVARDFVDPERRGDAVGDMAVTDAYAHDLVMSVMGILRQMRLCIALLLQKRS